MEKLVGNKDITAASGQMMSYPNPVTDNLTLEFDATEAATATAQVFDIYGRLV